MSIQSPKNSVDHPDRAIDCEFAIKPAFQSLAAAAQEAGWSENDVAQALFGLARANIKGVMEDSVLAGEIGIAQQMIDAMKGET